MKEGPLHIAVVIERFDPHAGGAERSTAQIAKELTQRGHRITILTGSSPLEVQEDLPAGVEVVSLSQNKKSSSALRLLRFSRWAKEQLEQGGFDTSLSVTMAVPARVLQPRGGTVRETLERNIALRPSLTGRAFKRLMARLDPKQRLLLSLEQRNLADPRVHKIVAVSRYVSQQLQKHYGIDAARIECIPNAAVMPQADEQLKQAWRQQVRESFRVPQEATAYLFAAQNPRLKGFEPLLAATKRLVDQGHQPVLLLAGSFWHGHQAQVEAMGLRDQVRFVRQTRQMPALYAAADVTVLPTFYDPASKVVIESLMMGTPAISTAYNGASDFLAPESGPLRGRVIADPADVDALASAMAELADPQARSQCRSAMVGLGEALSMTRHVDRLEAVLRHAAEGE
ncbi:MAG TPA: glycosyltransferase family 4 protein [Phycisphaeraceae bacterium]